MPILEALVRPSAIVLLPVLTCGVTDAVGEGYVTFVPSADELLPTMGTVILEPAQTSPKSVMKAGIALVCMRSPSD